MGFGFGLLLWDFGAEVLGYDFHTLGLWILD